jgi:hypothetical protein
MAEALRLGNHPPLPARASWRTVGGSNEHTTSRQSQLRARRAAGASEARTHNRTNGSRCWPFVRSAIRYTEYAADLEARLR